MAENNKDSNKDLSKLVDRFKSTVNPSDEDMEKLKDLAGKYSGRSEDDLYLEIINLNKKLSEGKNKDEFKKKLKKLEKLRPMLNKEQNKKLDKLIEMLEADIE